LDDQIAELDQRVNGILSFTTKDRQFWKDSWTMVKEIGSSFKNVRYPTKAEKDAAWRKFQDVVDQMRSEREKFNQKRDAAAQTSDSLKKKIILMAQSAWPRETGFETLAMALTGLIVAELFANIVVNVARSLLGMDAIDSHEKEKRKLMELSSQMKKAWNAFNDHKNELLPKDKADCFKILEGVQSELNKVWDEWRAEANERREKKNRELAEKREHKQRLIKEMRALIRYADQKDSKEQTEALMAEWKQVGFSGTDYDNELWEDFKSALDSFWTTRKKATVNRLKERLSNQEGFYEKLKGSVEHDEEVVEDKREKLSNVRPGRRADEIREHLESKIESLEQKIESKKEKLDQVESDIDELRRRIREID
jgi:Domain of Unknown Function (DUF349)